MFASGDIAQLTLIGNYLGQQHLNVFHYRMEDVPTDTWYTGLATEFQTVVLSKMRDLQVTSFNYTGIRIQSLFDASESYEVPLGVTGTIAAAADALLPSYVALYFKLLRGNARVRHGRKMIGGISETLIAGNAAVSAAFASITALATALSADLNAGGALDKFKPVLVGRLPELGSGGRTVYRLPKTTVEMADQWAYVKSAQFVGPSTMNTRKLGRGF